MLTREDYIGYLRQIGDFENEMVRAYGVLVELISTDDAKKVCSNILKQEKEHAVLVGELNKLFAVSA